MADALAAALTLLVCKHMQKKKNYISSQSQANQMSHPHPNMDIKRAHDDDHDEQAEGWRERRLTEGVGPPRDEICGKAGRDLADVVPPQILGAAVDGQLERLPAVQHCRYLGFRV